jgi:glycosyltransferase involved in cell wall biosynthesis
MSIYIDITEFLHRPHRTGIQRVTGELCRFWPSTVAAHGVRVRGNGELVRLPNDTLRVVSDYFTSDTERTGDVLIRIKELVAETADAPCLRLQPTDVLLCPEVFFDPVRVAFYRALGSLLLSRCCFIVYDLLPLTHPQFFDASVPHEIVCQYFRLLRDVGNHAFISRATQDAFHSRLLRSDRRSGIVAHLGSDSLGPRRFCSPATEKSLTFVVLGTIEPRKGHMMVLDAFEPLLESVAGCRLVFIGRMGWITSAQRQRLERFRSSHRSFQLLSDANDDTIREHVCNARATIFVSEAEGFGLPPVESLWLGTPVIVSRQLPSLEDFGEQGTCVVDPLTPEALRQAILALIDDGWHRRKVDEAAQLDLPRWEDFARNMGEWTAAVHSSPYVGT